VCHDAIYVGRTYNAAHYLATRSRASFTSSRWHPRGPGRLICR
jgi:hypothetical protein